MAGELNCIFCKIIKGEAPSYIVCENEHALAFFAVPPTAEYHTLVVSKNHYRNIFDFPPDEYFEMMAMVKQVVDMFHEKLGLENLQIINSSGSEAQQDVFHIHFHILPRAKGDGQDIKWNSHPEQVADLGRLLKKLRS